MGARLFYYVNVRSRCIGQIYLFWLDLFMTIKKIISCFLLAPFTQYFFCMPVAAAEKTVVDCDPVVHIGAQARTLQKALTALAEQYDFDLTFPIDADRAVESVDSMTLSQSLKYLTADVNTVLQHKKVEGCARPKLVAMEVLPVGENTEYVYVQPEAEDSQAVKPQAQVEAVFIDNMELYAEEVLLKQRELDKNLTAEQRREFREVKNEVRKRLEAEGLLEPGKQKNKDKNGMRFNGDRK